MSSATSKKWVYRYWTAGKVRWRGLGSFNVSLKDARLAREAYIRTNWSTWSDKHRDQWPSSAAADDAPSTVEAVTAKGPPVTWRAWHSRRPDPKLICSRKH